MIAAGPADLLAPGTAEVAILATCRVGGLVLVAPMFSGRTVPMPVRTALMLVLGLVLLPAAHASAIPGATLAPQTFLLESLIGFAIGFGAALLVGAAELAADLSAQAIGLAGAAVLDPIGGHQTSVLGQAYALLASTLLLVSGGHFVMLEAVARSFATIPVGAVVGLRPAFEVLGRQGGLLFILGLQFAAPVIAAALLANIGLGVVSRAVPSLNLMNLAFPVQIAIGLLSLAFALPFLGVSAAQWPLQVQQLTGDLLAALLRGAR